MFTRRSVMGLFGGLGALLLGRKAIMAAPATVLPETPAWLPDGFVPFVGQTLTAKEYPFLFTERKQGSRERFTPLFFGQDKKALDTIKPFVLDEIRASGWQDNLTHAPRIKPDERVWVKLLATKPQTRANGRVCPAGFCVEIEVKRSEYEYYFGAIGESKEKNLVWRSGYESIPPVPPVV